MSTERRIKALIFDFDGTLADTVRVVVRTKIDALEQMGYRDVDPDVVEMTCGMPLREAFYLITNEDNPVVHQAASDTFSRLFAQRSEDAATLFPGVGDVLQRLHNAGYMIGVFSTRRQATLERGLRLSGLEPLVDACEGEEGLHKPSADIVWRLLEKMGIAREETGDVLLIGDTTIDLSMGVNAGVRVAAVSFGAHTPRMLQFYKPEAVIGSWEELESAVKRLDAASALS